jgi:ABC-type Fe3+-hydroxamate transport system substrate-binding protein
MRIICTVPSITELLCDLGLEGQLVGVTKFCEHPVHIRKRVQIIGGTKNLRMATIRALKPDLCIANKEENVREQIEEIGTFCQVHVTEVSTYIDALKMIRDIAVLTNTQSSCFGLISKIMASRQRLAQHQASLEADAGKLKPKTCVYLIWREPYMTIGGDTFIHSMLEIAGFQNLFADETRYPEVSGDQLTELQPDCIFLSSEPYPFKQKHVAELQQICPAAHVQCVDGQAFSWYGSRLISGFDYLCTL